MRVAPTALAHEVGRDEPVVDEDLARADELERPHRDEPRVARPRADDRHPPHARASSDDAAGSSRGGPRRSAARASPTGGAPAGAARAPRARGPTRSAMSSRIRWASAGEAPPVETPTTIGSRRTIAGRMKLQSSGSSATLHSLGDRRHLDVHRAVVRRGDDEESIRRIVGLERPQQLGDREPPQLVVDLRRDDRDPAHRSRAGPAPSPSRPGRRRRRGSRGRAGRGRPCSSSRAHARHPGAGTVEAHRRLEPVRVDRDRERARRDGGDLHRVDPRARECLQRARSPRARCPNGRARAAAGAACSSAACSPPGP